MDRNPPLIRRAQAGEAGVIGGIDDPVAARDPQRLALISRAVAAGECFVAIVADTIAGYAVLEHSFYQRGFVSVLHVHSDYRRRGIGTALMQHIEQACRTNRLFISTNRSNAAMQALLRSLGYAQSGIVGDLDPGDPELVYSKRVGEPSLEPPPRPDPGAPPGVEPVQSDDTAEWLRLRSALWPHVSADEHVRQMSAILSTPERGAVFVSRRARDTLAGFVEASIREMAEGCTSHPVGYVEGWFVDPACRRTGIGRALLRAAEN
jgi:ribosomal protein S18 acetylase RimI-like enzyme